MADGADYQFVGSVGSFGYGNGQLWNAWGIACDPTGNLWIADWYNNRIEEFSSNGGFVTTVGGSGTGTGQFRVPIGIAADLSGNIWVADSGNDRIEIFSSSGGFVGTIGGPGNGDAQFSDPHGMTVDAAGNIWVADSANNRVQEFNSSGGYLGQVGVYGSGNGQLNYPTGVAVTPSGNIWITDYYNNRLEEFSSNGEFAIGWQFREWERSAYLPCGLAIAPSGDIWVADTGNDRMEEFSSDGSYLGQFGSFGHGNGQFDNPIDVAFDSSGNMWISDCWNNRVQEFANTPAPEPSTFVLLGVGAIGLVVCGWKRRSWNMKRLIAGSVPMVFLLFSLAVVHGQDTTYNLMNYPAEQNGYSLSGFITTDGMVGTLSSSDVQSWSVTVTNSGNSSYTFQCTANSVQDVFPSDNGGYINILSGVVATPTQLTIPPDNTTYGENLWMVGNADSITSLIIWSNVSTQKFSECFCPLGPFQVGSDQNGWATTDPQLNGSTTWIIAQAAAVPEPSTIAMLAVGAIGLLGWNRRRKAA